MCQNEAGLRSRLTGTREGQTLDQPRPSADPCRSDQARLFRGGRHPARLHGVGGLPADVGAGTGHRRRTVPALGPQHPAHRSGPGHDPARGQGPHGHRGADGGGLPHRGSRPAGTPAGHLPQPGHLCAAAAPGKPGVEETRHRPAGVRGGARPDHPGPAHRRRARRRPRVPGGAVGPRVAAHRQPAVDRRRRLPGGAAGGLGHRHGFEGGGGPPLRHAVDCAPPRHVRRHRDRAALRQLQPAPAGGRLQR